MNEAQKEQIAALRQKEYSYARVARELGLSENTVKSYCRRSGLSADAVFCRSCGRRILNKENQKPRQFCSDACRAAWWKSHPGKVKRKAVYSFVCAHCGRPFTAYGNSGRKYCCHQCYISARFGGGRSDE